MVLFLCLPDFNSIKVRLERSLLYSTARNGQFQFHKGTIRTSCAPKTSSTPTKFQFHKGTIRTLTITALVLSLLHFNSIKVRLEPLGCADWQHEFWFQFHKGTIRTIKNDMTVNCLHYFNSIKVRLEHSLFEESNRINEISIP